MVVMAVALALARSSGVRTLDQNEPWTHSAVGDVSELRDARMSKFLRKRIGERRHATPLWKPTKEIHRESKVSHFLQSSKK